MHNHPYPYSRWEFVHKSTWRGHHLTQGTAASMANPPRGHSSEHRWEQSGDKMLTGNLLQQFCRGREKVVWVQRSPLARLVRSRFLSTEEVGWEAVQVPVHHKALGKPWAALSLRLCLIATSEAWWLWVAGGRHACFMCWLSWEESRTPHPHPRREGAW